MATESRWLLLLLCGFLLSALLRCLLGFLLGFLLGHSTSSVKQGPRRDPSPWLSGFLQPSSQPRRHLETTTSPLRVEHLCAATFVASRATSKRGNYYSIAIVVRIVVICATPFPQKTSTFLARVSRGRCAPFLDARCCAGAGTRARRSSRRLHNRNDTPRVPRSATAKRAPTLRGAPRMPPPRRRANLCMRCVGRPRRANRLIERHSRAAGKRRHRLPAALLDAE